MRTHLEKIKDMLKSIRSNTEFMTTGNIAHNRAAIMMLADAALNEIDKINLPEINNDPNDYVSVEMAWRLKKLGFPVFQFYHNDEKFIEYGKYPNFGDPSNDEYYLIPTLSSVVKWLRNDKNIYIMPVPCIKDLSGDFSKCDYWECRVIYKGSESFIETNDNYEKALMLAINSAMTLVEQ